MRGGAAGGAERGGRVGEVGGEEGGWGELGEGEGGVGEGLGFGGGVGEGHWGDGKMGLFDSFEGCGSFGKVGLIDKGVVGLSGEGFSVFKNHFVCLALGLATPPPLFRRPSL